MENVELTPAQKRRQSYLKIKRHLEIESIDLQADIDERFALTYEEPLSLGQFARFWQPDF